MKFSSPFLTISVQIAAIVIFIALNNVEARHGMKPHKGYTVNRNTSQGCKLNEIAKASSNALNVMLELVTTGQAAKDAVFRRKVYTPATSKLLLCKQDKGIMKRRKWKQLAIEYESIQTFRAACNDFCMAINVTISATMKTSLKLKRNVKMAYHSLTVMQSAIIPNTGKAASRYFQSSVRTNVFEEKSIRGYLSQMNSFQDAVNGMFREDDKRLASTASPSCKRKHAFVMEHCRLSLRKDVTDLVKSIGGILLRKNSAGATSMTTCNHEKAELAGGFGAFLLTFFQRNVTDIWEWIPRDKKKIMTTVCAGWSISKPHILITNTSEPSVSAGPTSGTYNISFSVTIQVDSNITRNGTSASGNRTETALISAVIGNSREKDDRVVLSRNELSSDLYEGEKSKTDENLIGRSSVGTAISCSVDKLNEGITKGVDNFFNSYFEEQLEYIFSPY